MIQEIILHWKDEGLEEDHQLAYQEVNCRKCKRMVHCFNNEWMTSWVENAKGLPFGQEEELNKEYGIYEGIYCFHCLVEMTYGLEKEEFEKFIKEKSYLP